MVTAGAPLSEPPAAPRLDLHDDRGPIRHDADAPRVPTQRGPILALGVVLVLVLLAIGAWLGKSL